MSSLLNSSDPELRALGRKKQQDAKILKWILMVPAAIAVIALALIFDQSNDVRKENIHEYLVERGYTSVRVTGITPFSGCYKSPGYGFTAKRPDGHYVSDGVVCAGAFYYSVID